MNTTDLRTLYTKIEEIGYDYRNSTDLSKMINRVAMEAEDNARHTEGVTFYVEGSITVTDEGLMAWESSIETILACCDFVTDDAREWFTVQGIRF